MKPTTLAAQAPRTEQDEDRDLRERLHLDDEGRISDVTSMTGALAGALIGLSAGPVAAIAGAVVGSTMGALAGTAMERSEHAKDARDATLDAEIGVYGGKTPTGANPVRNVRKPAEPSSWPDADEAVPTARGGG